MATRIIEMVGPEQRRRFSDDDKARIVSEAMMPGASMLNVARRAVAAAGARIAFGDLVVSPDDRFASLRAAKAIGRPLALGRRQE